MILILVLVAAQNAAANQTNAWPAISNWFRANLTFNHGSNLPPAISNWMATTNRLTGRTNYSLNASNAWPSFSNWLQTNFAFRSSNNSVLSPTGRTPTNAAPGVEERLRKDFGDVLDLFRGKTNSP